ncbi:MAG TPA: ATP-binding protein [Thermoanaerobaculia bacterium]|nr:ATP-binding protein [Thermoanaerobaculia bacterium]
MNLLQPEDVLRVLHGFNPWWTHRSISVPPFHRLAFDACSRYLFDESIRRGVLIAGPRRVGKTTVLYQLAERLLARGTDPRAILYLSLDHPVLKLLTIEKIMAAYHDQVRPAGEPAYLLLDEVQYAQEWDLHLKFLIDHRREVRIVATGSAALRQRRDSIDSGVGRWITVPMPTLSFYEFLQMRGRALPHVSRGLRPQDLFQADRPALANLAESFRAILPEFQRYLLVGGFPETALHDETDYCQRILREDVVERVLKRDMVALFGVRKINELEKLFIYLCLNTGGVLSVKTCATELGTTAPTVAGYLELLENAHLVFRLAPSEVGGKKVLRQQSKYYLADAALRNAVLLRGEEILSDPEELGKVVETSVLRHLHAYHYLDTPTSVYWRDTRTNKEVDVIVKSPRYVIPVEVKYRKSASLDAADGLATYCTKDPRVRFAYLVTREDRDFGAVTFEGVPARFLKIPAHIFTYLLGQAEHALWEQAGRRAEPVFPPLPLG